MASTLVVLVLVGAAHLTDREGRVGSQGPRSRDHRHEGASMAERWRAGGWIHV
jgi:hypothetical protein